MYNTASFLLIMRIIISCNNYILSIEKREGSSDHEKIHI